MGAAIRVLYGRMLKQSAKSHSGYSGPPDSFSWGFIKVSSHLIYFLLGKG